MNYLKSLIDTPVRNTVIVLAITFVAYLLLAWAIIYLSRTMSCVSFDGPIGCRSSTGEMVFSRLLADFSVLTRYAAELSALLLIVQLVNRFVRRIKG